ncbi:hypothetical protein ACFFLM_00880 [Deinococcus oregonensis]|uniref:Uncharacterized protein n=1 Tax=Deinococcus oregonensis TaxID=1805970 RepID=A0ABV6ASQ6_9DEIO
MSIHPDPTSGLLLTDPVSGAVFRLPSRPTEPVEGSAADLKEVLDVWGGVYRLPAELLAPSRLSDAEAEAAAAELLADPGYLAHLVRELGGAGSEQLKLADLLRAQTPEAFAAALGALPGGDLEAADARLSAWEQQLKEAQAALTAAPSLVQSNLTASPMPPKQHPAMLALVSVLGRVSPEWVENMLAGRKHQALPTPPPGVPLPALPSFSYADLLGRPLEPEVNHEG